MRKNISPRLFFFCLILLVSNFNNILQSANKSLDSVRVKKCSDFKITGDGQSDQWNSAKWITLNVEGETSTQLKTKTKVLYSDTGIYFLFNCEDKKLTSSMKADNLMAHWPFHGKKPNIHSMSMINSEYSYLSRIPLKQKKIALS